MVFVDTDTRVSPPKVVYRGSKLKRESFFKPLIDQIKGRITAYVFLCYRYHNEIIQAVNSTFHDEKKQLSKKVASLVNISSLG